MRLTTYSDSVTKKNKSQRPNVNIVERLGKAASIYRRNLWLFLLVTMEKIWNEVPLTKRVDINQCIFPKYI